MPLFVLCSCNPEGSGEEPTVLLRLAESDDLQFPAQIDSAGVLLLSGDGGRALGSIDEPGEQADVDVIEVAATAGSLLRLSFLPGAGLGADLRPFLIVTDEFGEILALRDGSAERQALLQVVVPTRASLFVVLQDARNAKEGGLFGGASLDYTLNLSEEELSPTPLTDSVTSSLSPDGLQLFSLSVTPGQRVSIIVDPAVLADPAFVPFIAVYSSSFDLGVTFAAELPLQTLRGDFTAFGEQVLFGVSDFSGGLGSDYSFDLSVQVTP